MELDKTTLSDLSVFSPEEDFSVFGKLNETLTIRGKDELQRMLTTPLKTAADIKNVQQILKLVLRKESGWTKLISNGTIMVVERFFDSNIDQIPSSPSAIAAYTYKIVSGPDFSLVKYSAKHCFDFIKGLQHLNELLYEEGCPPPLKEILIESKKLTSTAEANIKNYKTAAEMPVPVMLGFAHFIRYRYKNNMTALLHIHAKLDAWFGMAMAVKKNGLTFPDIIESATPVIEAKGLYHILLNTPVPYDVELNRESNFLFLTGANMAGKSTFIKSVGIAVFLAHAGMGVPAQAMRLSVFDGMLSNINVVDNIIKGESYFFNEVQRIKATVNKVSDGRKWLILIDELFKGTNVQDAMKCSTAVIEGLIKIKNSLFILSTHLYEIGEDLKKYPNISFHYFETSITNDQLSFNYQLKDGISNDRLGYLILKKEGVVKMLEGL
ncbi:MAG: DNA mismatch repair protein MutS [Ferruginibacter sp.]